ncbi:MAG: hypothetical protein FJX46_09450 [Alphaproteobacteria bacterium]|nr:hypothetical protein [Alphaproteobacteria bacterium]
MRASEPIRFAYSPESARKSGYVGCKAGFGAILALNPVWRRHTPALFPDPKSPEFASFTVKTLLFDKGFRFHQRHLSDDK